LILVLVDFLLDFIPLKIVGFFILVPLVVFGIIIEGLKPKKNQIAGIKSQQKKLQELILKVDVTAKTNCMPILY
jgi:hypothetical protein